MNTRLRNYMIALAIILAAGAVTPLSYAQNRAYEFALPLNEPDAAFLGVQMAEVTESNMAQYKLGSVEGVIVRSVVEGSPAADANLKENDVLLEFDGIKVRSMAQFSRLVKETPPGRKVDILISRDGKRENISVRLSDQESRSADDRMRPQPKPFWSPGDGGFIFRSPGPDEGGMGFSRPRTPRLGITLQPLSEQLADFLGVPGKKGVLVGSVESGSPSYGKLKAGDVIVRAAEEAVESPEDLADLIRREADGPITFNVIRDKKEITVTVNPPAQEGGGFKL